MRVVVVGSGIAGLIVAIRASARHEVVLVTKAELAESNTRYAQGGIAAALADDDSVEAHIADTLRAGAGLCDERAVQILCTEGPQRVRELIELGVGFDRERDGELARGQEAAHSARRVLHAGGDATGRAIEATLLRALRMRSVEVHEHTFMRDLVLDPLAGEPRVIGIETVAADGSASRILGDVVVLASGGAGQLYLHTTNPVVTTGDGIAAAWRAGAQLVDMEFVQFHPTALAVPGSPLISEAVRGEGAVLRDENGARFMAEVHADAELAPRDVVARGIAAAMARQGGRPVLLDATDVERARGTGFLAARFPTLSEVTRAHGVDWTTHAIPVTPAAHYAMGGIRTDLEGRTSLAGLVAVGEVACTGVHGANRLASNSLLESLVFACRVAEALDASREQAAAVFSDVRDVRYARLEGPPQAAVTRGMPRRALQTLMWNAAGLERSAPELRTAQQTLSAWSVGGDDVASLEDRNLLDLARVLVHAARVREESRGAHHRTDHPDALTEARHALAWAHPARILEGAVR